MFSSRFISLSCLEIQRSAQFSVKRSLNLFVRKLEPVKESQSDLLADHSIVYDLQMHNVKSTCMADYLKLLENFSEDVASKAKNSKLAGVWTVDIGEQDLIYILWKFNGYQELNSHYINLRSDENYLKFRTKQNSMLNSRQNQICLPFTFWPKPNFEVQPDKPNRIYEIRSYNLKPGTMIEWGNHWARAITKRTEGEAVCGLFSHIGILHMVHHIWVYNDFENRSKSRDDAWRSPGWDDCVLHTVPLIKSMSSTILRPTSFSPLR